MGASEQRSLARSPQTPGTRVSLPEGPPAIPGTVPFQKRRLSRWNLSFLPSSPQLSQQNVRKPPCWARHVSQGN